MFCYYVLFTSVDSFHLWNNFADLSPSFRCFYCKVCGHKWADLSEHDWGVALMTDCKYGYSTHANAMYISL